MAAAVVQRMARTCLLVALLICPMQPKAETLEALGVVLTPPPTKRLGATLSSTVRIALPIYVVSFGWTITVEGRVSVTRTALQTRESQSRLIVIRLKTC